MLKSENCHSNIQMGFSLMNHLQLIMQNYT